MEPNSLATGGHAGSTLDTGLGPPYSDGRADELPSWPRLSDMSTRFVICNLGPGRVVPCGSHDSLQVGQIFAGQ